MTKALEGVRILDFTHVQSGPTCTQLLAWFGADVIKVERPGVGDITRGQLQDIPNVDSLYFTMLNHNKRSITLDTKNPKGKEVLTELIKQCDVLVENFGPGVLDRMGFPWEKIQAINPKMIVASIKGFGPGPYEDCKVYENVAQCTGGAASTTGFRDGVPLVTGAQIGDSGTGLHLALGIVTALYQRTHTGKGQRVTAAMQDGVLNLCRVKLRDQQRLAHGPLKEYSQFGEGVPFGDAVPRAGNDSGGGQPGRILKCKGWETDPNAYIYFITQGPGLGEDLRRDRRALVEDRSELRQAGCAPAASQRDLRPHRAVDDVQDQVRGNGDPQQGRHPLRPDPVDEGDRRGRVAARDRHRGRGRPPHPRQVHLGRQPDQAVGLSERRAALPAARRAHRRDPAFGAGLQRPPGRRDPQVRRARPAAEAGRGVSQAASSMTKGPPEGAAFLLASAVPSQASIKKLKNNPMHSSQPFDPE
ncbi:crotonobetainyl-CoA:carnitine CoA-transferase CaiB-like acyl-CoA transferase [Bradyrhizobium liaoningense]